MAVDCACRPGVLTDDVFRVRTCRILFSGPGTGILQDGSSVSEPRPISVCRYRGEAYYALRAMLLLPHR